MRTRNHGGPSRRAGSLMAKRNNAGYLFICPFLVGMLFIFLPSLVESFSYSLEFATVQFDSVAREYVGFQNYIAALTEDTEFLRSFTGLSRARSSIWSSSCFSAFSLPTS